MVSIQTVCKFGDHFWYPEIQKQIEELSTKAPNPTDLKVTSAKINLATLYQKRSDTPLNEITIFVLKILHNLQLFFLKNYAAAFQKSVELLTHAVERKKIVQERFIRCKNKVVFQNRVEKLRLGGEKLIEQERRLDNLKHYLRGYAIQRRYKKLKQSTVELHKKNREFCSALEPVKAYQAALMDFAKFTREQSGVFQKLKNKAFGESKEVKEKREGYITSICASRSMVSALPKISQNFQLITDIKDFLAEEELVNVEKEISVNLEAQEENNKIIDQLNTDFLNLYRKQAVT